MEALLTREGRAAPYSGCNSFGPTYGEHRNALELSIEQMAELKAYSESLGLVFFASAWDDPSLVQILDLDVELLKISSAELVNVPLVRKYAQAHVPIILSTGMSSLEDIDVALAEINAYHDDVVLLHCNSTYPCPEDQIGLPVMDGLRERYSLPVGYSGHEQGIAPSVGAAALGACVVERHFTLDKSFKGTDHQRHWNRQSFHRWFPWFARSKKPCASRARKFSQKSRPHPRNCGNASFFKRSACRSCPDRSRPDHPLPACRRFACALGRGVERYAQEIGSA